VVKVLRNTQLTIQNINGQSASLTTPFTLSASDINGAVLNDLSAYGTYVNGTSGQPLKGEAGAWSFQFAAESKPELQGFNLTLTKNSIDTVFSIRFMDDNDKAAGGQIVNQTIENKPRCATCHGTDGASPNENGGNKTINGKTPITTINLIRAYRDGANSNASSTLQKRTNMNLLTPEEVIKVAWYLSEK
jgi:cytochrome c553